jgi:hypothetical protein
LPRSKLHASTRPDSFGENGIEIADDEDAASAHCDHTDFRNGNSHHDRRQRRII